MKTTDLSDYFKGKASNDSNLRKIILFNLYFDRQLISKLPRDKLVLFVWEPEIFPMEFYEPYPKVYTWDDSLIDNKKFFRFNYPYLMPIQENLIPFKARKLCIMVARHGTRERLDSLQFFSTNHPQELDCYGRTCLNDSFLWKGAIPGLHSGKEKISVLQKYRFCICFENTIGLQGYITKKSLAVLLQDASPFTGELRIWKAIYQRVVLLILETSIAMPSYMNFYLLCL